MLCFLILILYPPKAFKSPSCLELYEEMGKFENCYLEFLVSENETFSQDWSEANWSQFHSLKGAVEIIKEFGCLSSMDFSNYFLYP